MAGNTATLQIKIDVDNKGTVTLDQVSKSLTNVDAAARKASVGLGAADKGLSGTSSSAAKAASGTAAAAKSLDTADSSARKAAGGLGAASSSMDKLASAAAAYLTLDAAGKVIGMADEMSVLSSKVGLATGSMEEQRAVQQQLYAMSQATRSEIGVNANAFFGYSTALNSTGASSKDVLGVIDMVNKSLKVSGATAGEASSFVLQFKQALGSGVLQGDEFRSMTENNVVFARALAEALDTDVTGLRAMSSAGELTTRKLATLFPEMAANISAAFDKIPVTVEGATTQIENAFKMALAGANETTGGTNKLATQISGLAVIVQENAPAIGALFNGVVLGAQGFVRLGSFVVGTFETIAAAALAASGVIFKVGEGIGWLTDQIGITEQAAQRWRAESDAAFGAAGGLAGQAADNYTRMTRSTAEAEKAQKDWLKSLQGGSAAVLADIDAQKKREAEHAGSVQNMSKAEKKAADERAKVLDEMHKSIGGEEYYRREADKVLAHVEVLKKAGATQEQQAQYTYEKIADLSAQAWKKGETAAGEYLDQLKGTMADSVNLETAAQAKREAAQASSLDKMANAEKKAADDRAKVIDEMYKGIGGEAFYQHEAENVLAHVEVLRQAGATQQEQAQYTYGKLAELSEQAWQKGETAAGKYLDTLRATMTSATGVTAEASKAQSDAIIKAFEKTGAGAQQYYDVQRQRLTEERDQVIALTGDSLKANQWYAAELEKLKAKTSSPVTVKVDADPSTFDQKAAASRQQSAELAATTATVKIDADTAQFDSAMSSAQQSAASAGGQFAVNTASAEDLKAAIQQLNDMPTLDPFGATRAKFQELLQVVAVQEQQAALERNAKLVEQEKQSASERLGATKEYYDAQKEAAKEAFDAQREGLKEQIDQVKEAAREEIEARKEVLEKTKSYMQEQIDAVKSSMDQESALRSAYKEMYSSAGVGGEQALQAEASEVYEKAQKFRDAGAQQVIVEQYVQAELKKLREKANKDGVQGLDSFISTLENSYRATGNFSDATVKANTQMKSLEGQIKSLEEQTKSLNDQALDKSNQQVKELEGRLKMLEDIGIEAWFDGGTNAAAGLSAEIKRLDEYLDRLTSKERTIKLGVEDRKEVIKQYEQTGKIATPRGYEDTYAGGGYTWDGPRSGGMDGIGGRQALLHPQETVIDHLRPDRAAIVSLYDQFVAKQGAASSASSSAAPAAAAEAPINIGTLIIQQATDVDGIMREIRRRAVR